MELFCPECGRGFDGDQGPDCPEDGRTLLSAKDTDHPLVGELIQDRFRPVEVLGEGGAGTVFRAVQRPIGREVAVKVLSDKLRDDDTSYDRFFREAKLASSLRHPNIVSPVDFGEDEEHGVVFFAMEYVDGIDLYDLLAEHRVTVPLALEIVHQTCGALTDAHAQGIIHRDLKPRNLRLTVISDGSIQVKTLDLGVARPLESTQEITQEDNLAGTTSYLPPEYILEGDLGTYSDLYSLGIILFEMLTGQKPFSGKRMQVMFHHIRTSPPSINDTLPDGEAVPEFVESFYRRLVEKDPGERIGSAQEARSAVEQFRSEFDIDSVELDDPSSTARIATFEPWLEESMPTIEDVESLSSGVISDLRGAGAQIEERSGSNGPRVQLPTPPPLPAHNQQSEASDQNEPEKSKSKKHSLPTPGGAATDGDESPSEPSSARGPSDLLAKLTSKTKDESPDSNDDTPGPQDDVEVEGDLSEASDASDDEPTEDASVDEPTNTDDAPTAEQNDPEPTQTPPDGNWDKTRELSLDDIEIDENPASDSSADDLDATRKLNYEDIDLAEPVAPQQDSPSPSGDEADETDAESPFGPIAAKLTGLDRQKIVAIAASVAVLVFGSLGVLALNSLASEDAVSNSEAVADESDEFDEPAAFDDSEETSDEALFGEPESVENNAEKDAAELAETAAGGVVDETHIVGASLIWVQEQQEEPDIDTMRSAVNEASADSTDRRSPRDSSGGGDNDTDEEPTDELDRLLEQAGTP